MYDAMAHRPYFLQRTDYSHLFIGQFFDYQLHGYRMVRHVRLHRHLSPACRLMGDGAAVNPNPFTQALGQYLFAFAVD